MQLFRPYKKTLLDAKGTTLNLYLKLQYYFILPIDYGATLLYNNLVKIQGVNMNIEKVIQKANKLAQKNKIDKLRKLEKVIVDSGDIVLMFNFAEAGVPGTNVTLFEDEAIKSGNSQWIYYFARYVKGSNIAKLQDAIIKTGDAWWIFRFAEDVKGADIARLWTVMQATNDQKWIDYFKSEILSQHPEILKEEQPNELNADDDENEI